LANLNRLRHLREQHNLSQRALAEALGAYDNEEFDPKRISVYETGKAEPDIETLDKLAHFFGVTVDYLIGRETTVFPKPEDSDLCLWAFGKRVRQCRTEKNISAKELSLEIGISQTYLLLIEAGKKIPKLETAIKILNALGASADAAFMDSLVSGYTVRSHYLEIRMAALRPEKQKFMLDMIESMIEKLEEDQGIKKASD